MAYLKEKYPSKIFTIIMGSDSFKNIDNWKNSDVLRRDNCFIVYQRKDFEIPADSVPSNVLITNAPILELSSTLIRQSINEGKSIRYLVPELVREEIEKNNYYKQITKNKTNF
jgi:nicotinate-nucleotide adenylyltransferase